LRKKTLQVERPSIYNNKKKRKSMGHLSISDLLRNALPGGVFLIVAALGYPSLRGLAFPPATEAGGGHGLFEATMLFALAHLRHSQVFLKAHQIAGK
jgi:hypothetical protein